MKKHKIFFQKYNKKYTFLQNSLFDFLYWRTCKGKHSTPLIQNSGYTSFIHENQVCNNQQFKTQTKNCQQFNTKNSNQNISFLNEENIYLSEYWKSSDAQKVQQVFQNLNKKISVSSTEDGPFFDFWRLDFRPMHETSQTKQLNSLSTPQEGEFSKEKLQNGSIEKFQRLKKQNEKKNMYSFRKTFFQTRKKMKKKQRNTLGSLESEEQTFLQKTHFFQTFQNFEFFGPFFCFLSSSFLSASQMKNSLKRQSQFQISEKAGEFFSKKKHFQQYWVFSLLGFVLFVCTQSSFLRSSDQEKISKNFQKTSFFEVSKNKMEKEEMFSNFFEKKRKTEKNTTIPSFEYSYANQNLKKIYRNFQKTEKNEFEQFSNFYLKILEKSFFSFYSDSLTRSFPNSGFQSFPFFSVDKIRQQNKKQFSFLNESFFKNEFKEDFERNRNIFAWTWYTLQLNDCKPALLCSFNQQIPQKAQFFGVLNSSFENSKKKSTPFVDFTRSLFLLNEFEKNLSFFEKNENKSFFHFRQISKFFKYSTPEEFLFLNSLNSDRVQNSQIFSDFFSNSENLMKMKKSLFFKNWLSTTNGFGVSLESGTKQKNDQRKMQNFQDSHSKIQGHFSTENFQLLDSIYFQKVFRKQIKKKGKSFENFELMSEKNSFQKFLKKPKAFRFRNLSHSIFHNFSKVPKKPTLSRVFSFLPEKTKKRKYPFFEFQKQTFQVLTFQSFTKNLNEIENFSEKSKFMSLFKEKKKEKQKNAFFEFQSPFAFSIFEKNSKNALFKNTFDSNKERSTDFSVTHLSSPIVCDFSNLQNSSLFFSPFFSEARKSSSQMQKEKRAFAKKNCNSPFAFSKSKYDESGFSSKNFTLSSNQTNQKSNFFFLPTDLKTLFQYSNKKSQYENFSEKFFTNLQKKNIFSLFSFDFFQKNFFFEKMEKKKAMTFQTHKNMETLFFYSFQFSRKNNTQFFKKNFFFLKNSSFVLKLKSTNMNKKQTKQKNFRKFEKVFQTFFSPLNRQSSFSNVFDRQGKNEKIFSSSRLSELHKKQKKLFFLKYNSLHFFEKSQTDKKVFSKLQKEKFLLKTLSFSPAFHHFLFLKSLKSENLSKNQNKLQYSKYCSSISSFAQKKHFLETKIEKKEKILPEFVLKRDGFVIVPSQKKIHEVQFWRKKITENAQSNFSNSLNFDFERFEKEKSLQKKRRLKKQKLETRRRKKRKRFFPRPVWLRFHLYKKFLKIRHPLVSSKKSMSTALSTSLQKDKGIDLKAQILSQPFNSAKKRNDQISSENISQIEKIFLISPENQNRHELSNFVLDLKTSKKGFEKRNQRNTQKNFKEKKSNSVFFKNSTNLTKKNFNVRSFVQKKETNWSIYWKHGFHQKNVYTKRPWFENHNAYCNWSSPKAVISTNANHYKISGDILSEFLRLSWKSYWFQTNSQPYTSQISKNFKKMLQVESQNNFNFVDFLGSFKYSVFFQNVPSFFSFDQDLILQKSLFKKFLWYCNIRNSLCSNPVEKNSFNFQKIQNIPEYNRILYARVSELLRRFQFSENNESPFSFESKILKRKDEKLFSNPSIFTKSALFFEKFQIPSQPSIAAFSVFSSLFHDSSRKPTGDMATLRSLWAFQKTNFFHFQETNPFRNLWTFQKRAENLKSLKATKKALNFLTKYSEIEKINTSFLNFEFKTKFEIAGTDFDFQHSEKFKKKFQVVPKREFLLSLNFQNKRKGDRDSFENLENFSFQKYRNVEKKCSLFGIRSFKRNSKFSLRYFKFQLLSNRFQSLAKNEKNTQKLFHFDDVEENNAKNSFFHFEKNSTFQNSAQSSLNFWWAQKNWNSKDFFYSNEQFLNPCFLSPSESETPRFLDFCSIQMQFLFFSTFVFHLAIFLTLFKLPEVRSVFKFQCLVFYKVLDCFFGIFFAIHNLFEKYAQKSVRVFKMLLNSKTTQNEFSECFQLNFKEKTSLNQFGFDFSQKNSVSPLSFFSKKNNEEKTFFYLFLLRFSSLSNSFKKIQKQTKEEKRKNEKKFSSLEKFRNRSDLQTQYTQSAWFSIFSDRFKQKQSETYEFFFFEKDEKFSVFFENDLRKKRKKTNQFHFDFSKRTFQNQNLTILMREPTPLRYGFIKTKTKLQNLRPFEVSEQNDKRDFFKTSAFNFGKQTKAMVFFSPKFGTFQYFLKVFSNTPEAKKSVFNQVQVPFQACGDQKLQKMKGSEKIAFEIALSLFLLGKRTTLVGYNIVQIASGVSSKIFEVVEALLFSIYKFLEKPAEFMIEWIAFLFLIEWSSDILTFVPDTLDTTFWKTAQKTIRQTRSSSFFLNTLNANQSLNGSFSFLNSLVFFHFSNMFTYIVQKRMLYFVEHLFASALQPDIDILIRQKKGMIFWDIWAEILLKAAEKYNVNIASFVTLKEEQELFLEKFLQDPEFFKTLQRNHSEKNFASFVQNFLVLNRPEKLFDPNFVKSVFSPGFSNCFSSKNSSSFCEPVLFQYKFQTNREKSSNFFEKDAFGTKKSFLYLKKNSFVFPNTENDNNQFALSSETDRWACNQYGTFQSSETDLFIDIHPSKSLKNIHFLKYFEPAQYTLGSIICQVYSGLFPKQVSKNILVLGAQGTAKTLFIQALAGETEMKIITDNAYRYSMVQRGVAVGMKYLRDVFDAIALQTPCFFLIEHIHVIGSKRPFLISDDENGKGNQSSFGLEQQEVHETNQMIYQSSRHSISDFKRPYKGDFSMGIATNFFLDNFPSLEKMCSSLNNSQFSGQNFSSQFGSFLQSPFPIDSIEASLKKQGFSENANGPSQKTISYKIQTSLQFSKEQIFAPPATSPFTVLMMKEQKKLKPKKIAKEISWGGLSADQIVSYQKETYSIRAKVAALADITMNLSRGKLDMITDFLVIIDSVRSNRGFVVFGTTHLPSLLDPALRRPGRFDETLSLAQSPNFFNRFEILRINFENSISTFDFLDSSILTENFSEMNLFSLITETKLSFFHQYKYTEFEKTKTPFQTEKKSQFRIFSQLSPEKAFQIFLKSSFFTDLYDQKLSVFGCLDEKLNQKRKKRENQLKAHQNQTKKSTNQSRNSTVRIDQVSSLLRDSKRNFTIFPKGPSHALTLAYSQIGIFLAQANFYKDPRSFTPLSLDKQKLFLKENFGQFVTSSLYEKKNVQKLQLMVFLSGKITEFFVCAYPKQYLNPQTYSSAGMGSLSRSKKKQVSPNQKSMTSNSFSSFFESMKQNKEKNANAFFQRKFSLFLPIVENSFVGFQDQTTLPEQTIQKSNVLKNDFFWTAFGNDESWRSATPFLFALVQKRLFFTKNLLLSKMLFFENNNQRRQPPSPPNSSILMPSKKYENFKRTERDFFQKARFSINEKIQMHQKQRFLKQLYNIPVQKYFRSEFIQKRQTFFSSSFQELAYLDSLTRQSSSSHFYQQKYFARHSFSHVHQWWNGMLPEHNTETTYLSDVDWRTIFLKRKPLQQRKTEKKAGSPQKLSKTQNTQSETLEFNMDFPDAEQYYNPRNRRWYLNTKNNVLNSVNNSNYWLTFDLNLQYEIYYHFLMQSFHESFHYFDNQREMLDFCVFHLLNKGFLNELDFLTTFSRFQIKQ